MIVDINSTKITSDKRLSNSFDNFPNCSAFLRANQARNFNLISKSEKISFSTSSMSLVE